MLIFPLFDSCSRRDQRTDQWTDKAFYRVACPQLKSKEIFPTFAMWSTQTLQLVYSGNSLRGFSSPHRSHADNCRHAHRVHTATRAYAFNDPPPICLFASASTLLQAGFCSSLWDVNCGSFCSSRFPRRVFLAPNARDDLSAALFHSPNQISLGRAKTGKEVPYFL